MGEVVWEFSHDVYFSTKNQVPIADVVASLIAFERIIKQAPQVFSSITGAEVEHVDVLVEELQSGSLGARYLLKLFFKNEEELELFLDRIRENLKDRPMLRNTLLTAVIATMIGMGLLAAANMIRSPEAAKTIQANNNVIINIGAGEVNMTPEQFTAVVMKAIGDKKALARDSVRFMAPARTDKNSSVSFDESDLIAIPPEVVAVAPSNLEVIKEQKSELMPDVDLHIRATNLDSSVSGWAGLINGLSERRLPLELSDEVDPMDVAGNLKVRADVEVIYEPRGQAKIYKPVKLVIIRLIDAD